MLTGGFRLSSRSSWHRTSKTSTPLLREGLRISTKELASHCVHFWTHATNFTENHFAVREETTYVERSVICANGGRQSRANTTTRTCCKSTKLKGKQRPNKRQGKETPVIPKHRTHLRYHLKKRKTSFRPLLPCERHLRLQNRQDL